MSVLSGICADPAYNIEMTIIEKRRFIPMAKFRLVKYSPIGRHTEITDSFEAESLIEAGENLSRKNPENQFAVIDELGFYIWPEHLKIRTWR